MKRTIFIIAAILTCLIAIWRCGGNSRQKNTGDSSVSASAVSDQDTLTTTITISPDIPFDVNDPSNLAEAANFAWNEFIAVTWPAQAQGPVSFPRGKALANGRYGDKGPTGQVVWETFRHRTEAFPGQYDPNGYDPTKADYGFGARPLYRYLASALDSLPNSEGLITPYFKNTDPNKIPPFNNLDEVTQISLNAMYSGRFNHQYTEKNSRASDINDKILFEAKINETYYKYVAGKKYYKSDSTAVMNIKNNSVNYAESGNAAKYPPPYITLPASDFKNKINGSIEIKAAWRKLNPKTEDISKFYTARVRYYKGILPKSGMDSGLVVIQGYVDSDDPQVNEVWGLVALHIIQKTPHAPAFIYATFGHFDNILDPKGNSVEDADGTTFPQYQNIPPFSPALSIQNSTPTNFQKVTTTSGVANTNSPQLYFYNVAGKEAIINGKTGKLYSGPVNINRRIFEIPPTIVKANKAAHDLIKKANPKAVWLNYKLINVQAEPLDYLVDSAKINNGMAPTYFLANEVVETNPSLQQFSGGLNVATGTISNFDTLKRYIHNTYLTTGSTVKAYNMGGCMGCHGSQGLKQGGDFSVILARGRNAAPDIVQENEAAKLDMYIKGLAYTHANTGLPIKKNRKK